MNQMFSILKRSPLWLVIAALGIGLWLFSFLQNNRPSIEFTGGISFGVEWAVDADKLEQTIQDSVATVGEWLSYDFATETDDTTTNGLLKITMPNDDSVKALTQALKQNLVEDGIIGDESELSSFSIIGPSIGDYMRSSAKWAIIVWLILMALYMMISFASVRKVIPPFVLAAVVIVTMFFDVSVPAGAYGLLMKLNSTIQVDTVFIIAILTTMWYSINDTIIIFDRIRENIVADEDALASGSKQLGTVVEKSLWETMRRSLWTSISTLLVVIAMYVLGTGVIKTFAFVIGIGIVAGTFSSIFIAAPLMYVLMGKYGKEKLS